jgi:hypothetical protein
VRIKLSTTENYSTPDLEQFLDSDALSKDQYFLNESTDYADAWFVSEGTLPTDQECFVPENRVFFLGAETARPLGYFYETPGYLDYLRQFTRIYTPQDLYWDNARLSYPFLPWMVNSNHGPDLFASSLRDLAFFRGLKSLEKTKTLSVLCSSQNLTADHRARFRFVSALKDHFGDRLDWFGNGVNSIKEKWEGLADYKYTIVLENQSSSYVMTEKIQDAFLALAMPIYWGAPEAKGLFPEGSLVTMNIRDIPGSIKTIEKLLATDPYQSVLPSLIQAKKTVTDELNFLFRIRKILDDTTLQEPALPSRIKLRQPNYFSTILRPASRSPLQHKVDNLAKAISSFFGG